MRAALTFAALAALACVSRRTNRDGEAPPPAADRPRPAPADAPDSSGPERPRDAWRDPALVSAAVSNALAAADGGDPVGVAADVAPDQSRATMRLVRWGPRGALECDRAEVSGTAPGAAISLARRAGGYVAVWFGDDGDGGVRARAIELDGAHFTGAEREATGPEAAAAEWARVAGLFRRRQGAREMAPPVSDGDLAAQVEVRRSRPTPSLVLGPLVVTQGDDLLGFEPSIALAATGDARRWVAASRGRCAEARVEVFLVDGEAVETRGRFLFGTETGVRWIRLDATADEAVVTWYQSLIPLRIDCIRGPNGATLEDHGVRVARVKAVGPAPRPLPDAGDAGADGGS